MTLESVRSLGQAIDEGLFVIGVFILALEIGLGLLRRTFRRREVWDMATNLSTQLPSVLVDIILLAFVYLGYQWVSARIPWTLPIDTSTALLAVLLADFAYYWEHRLSHEVRVLWTQHAVHHSSRYFNVTVGARFGPFEGVASAILHFPLVLLGIPAELVFFGMVVVLAYQTWIHTELIGSLGAFDAVFNSPANHRVHHGSDAKYLDKNYGGILIVWDRLFGTYQREEERPRYGLKRNFDSVHPIVVWFSELPQLVRDLRRARSSAEVWGYLFGPPGWTPDRR